MLADAETSKTLVVDKDKGITLVMNKYKLAFTGDSGSVITVKGTFTANNGGVPAAQNKIINPVTNKELTINNPVITGGKGSGTNKLGGEEYTLTTEASSHSTIPLIPMQLYLIAAKAAAFMLTAVPYQTAIYQF